MGSKSGSAFRASLSAGPSGDRSSALAVLTVGYVLILLWVPAWLSSVLTGNSSVRASLLAPVVAFENLADPSAAWGQPVGPPALYWSLTFSVLLLGLGPALFVWRRSRAREGRPR